MKNIKLTPVVFALAGVLALVAVRAWSAPAPAPMPSTMETGTHATVQLKVLNVFSAQDGDAIFRAYLVEWNGQEVIVEDTLAKTNYQVGEMMNVLVMKSPYPKNQEPHGLLHFAVVPRR